MDLGESGWDFGLPSESLARLMGGSSAVGGLKGIADGEASGGRSLEAQNPSVRFPRDGSVTERAALRSMMADSDGWLTPRVAMMDCQPTRSPVPIREIGASAPFRPHFRRLPLQSMNQYQSQRCAVAETWAERRKDRKCYFSNGRESRRHTESEQLLIHEQRGREIANHDSTRIHDTSGGSRGASPR